MEDTQLEKGSAAQRWTPEFYSQEGGYEVGACPRSRPHL